MHAGYGDGVINAGALHIILLLHGQARTLSG